MSFDGSRLSVPPGSPMIRAPPLAVLLFLPPCPLAPVFGIGSPRGRARGVRAGTAGRVQRQVPYRSEISQWKFAAVASFPA